MKKLSGPAKPIKGFVNIVLDSIFSSYIITILIIAFEITFYLLVINNQIENSTGSITQSMPIIYIDVEGILNKNQTYSILPPEQKTIITSTVKQLITNTIKKSVDQIVSDINSRKKKYLTILLVLYGLAIVIGIIVSVLLRKKIAWLQILIFSIITLLMIGSAEAYLYFEVYSQLQTVNSASMQNKINEAVKSSLV
jgi:uncharacterized protein YacL